MPWERGDVLCPAPVFQPAFPRGRLILGRPESSSGSLASGFGAKVQLEPVLKSVRGGLPAKFGPTWEEKLTLNRRAAMAKWESLVWKNKDSFEVARNVLQDASKGRQADLSQALADCFAGKASATLHSRVGPLLRYVHFMSKEHDDPSPLDEGKLYMFMDKASPSLVIWTTGNCFKNLRYLFLTYRLSKTFCLVRHGSNSTTTTEHVLASSALLCTCGHDTATLRRQQRCSWTS